MIHRIGSLSLSIKYVFFVLPKMVELSTQKTKKKTRMLGIPLWFPILNILSFKWGPPELYNCVNTSLVTMFMPTFINQKTIWTTILLVKTCDSNTIWYPLRKQGNDGSPHFNRVAWEAYHRIIFTTHEHDLERSWKYSLSFSLQNRKPL